MHIIRGEQINAREKGEIIYAMHASEIG